MRRRTAKPDSGRAAIPAGRVALPSRLAIPRDMKCRRAQEVMLVPASPHVSERRGA